MRLILNEKKILEKSLNDGYIDKDKPSHTMRTLIKHYFSIGMNKSQINDTVDKFFALNLSNYNSMKWQKSIENMINYVHRIKDYTLLNINEVEIRESELNIIKNIDNVKLEKLAFTLLVYAKIYNQINGKDENWVNEEHRNIFSDAKVSVGIKDQGKMIHNLNDLGLVESSVMVDSTNIKVNFAELESKVVLVINDFRNYVLEYLRWKGENIINCEECGILFYPTNNSHKNCKSCWKDKQLAWQRESMQKLRNKNKCEVSDKPANATLTRV